ERQEIENSLLFKELNKSTKKQDFENLDRYLIVLGLLALAEQRLDDFEQRHWIELIILKQLKADPEIKQKFKRSHFNIVRNLEERDTE
ncbi:27177_t:CDS:1, partial [Dentiscutata erythropus]